jgi:hypothetical protein
MNIAIFVFPTVGFGRQWTGRKDQQGSDENGGGSGARP